MSSRPRRSSIIDAAAVFMFSLIWESQNYLNKEILNELFHEVEFLAGNLLTLKVISSGTLTAMIVGNLCIQNPFKMTVPLQHPPFLFSTDCFHISSLFKKMTLGPFYGLGEPNANNFTMSIR